MTLLYSQGATLKMQHLSNWGRTEWIIPLTTLVFLYTGKNEPQLDTRRCDGREMQKHVNRHPALTFLDLVPSVKMLHTWVQAGGSFYCSVVWANCTPLIMPPPQAGAQPLSSNQQSKPALSFSFIKITLVYLGGDEKKI